MTLRVVHVSAYFAPAFVYGGPPRSILALCRAQRAAGFDVSVVTTTANGDDELPAAVTAAGAWEGIPVDYCPRTPPARIFRAASLGPRLAARLRDADVLHVHGLWNAAVWQGRVEARRAGVPYMLSPRGMLEPAALAHEPWRKRASWLARDRRVVADAAVLHATSEAERATLAARWPAARVVCVPNGVSAPAPREAPGAVRGRLGLPTDAPLVLYLGRVHPIKRLDLLARAFAVVRARHPRAHLVVAGPDEDGARAGLAAAFAPLGDAVTWTGRVDEATAAALLEESATLVLCSDSESFGASVAEALAAGRPVVVTRTCPWAVVEAEGAGYWVDQTPEAVGDAVGRLLADPARAVDMGARGRALAARAFSWPGVAARLGEEYERMRAEHAGG